MFELAFIPFWFIGSEDVLSLVLLMQGVFREPKKGQGGGGGGEDYIKKMFMQLWG